MAPKTLVFLSMFLAALLTQGVSGSILKKRSSDYGNWPDYLAKDAEEGDYEVASAEPDTSNLGLEEETWKPENVEEPEPETTTTGKKHWHEKVAHKIREGLGEAHKKLGHFAKKGWNWLSTTFGEEDARDQRQTKQEETAVKNNDDYPVWV